ncbi:PIR protein [Plasmodium vivax]|uniref:VIR protein n=1 Tax=Plasmodium vivax TaxID=5855 RepID=A0A565A5T2_PLAVI|nr:PIR protein [Plasmodium vivax]
MGTHLTKKDLEKLTSNILYSNFEDDKWTYTNYTFYSSIIDDENLYPLYKQIFPKLLNALCYVYTKKVYLRNTDSDLCSYMYYWIGEKIYDISDSTPMFTKIMNMLYGEFNITDNGRICEPLDTSIDKETFKKNKMLFDYSKNYEHINLSTVSGSTTCEKDYINFINEYITIYKDAHSNCNKVDQKNYDCTYFHKLFEKDEHTKLTSFYCRQQNTPTLSTETHEGHQEEEDNIFPFPTREQYPKSVGHHIARNHSPNVHGYTRLNTVSVAHRALDDNTPPITDQTAEGGSSRTIAGSVVPVLGVSSISLLLYKVTPVGGFINKLLGRNMNMHNNIENMDMFNPYSDEMDPGGRRMNISYHRF